MLKSITNLKIGFFSIGFNKYWSQMPGILDELKTYSKIISQRISEFGELIDAGLIDNIEKSRKANDLFHLENVDIIFLHVGIYAPSENIIRTLFNLNVPVITLHLQSEMSFNQNSNSIYTLPKNTFSAGGEIGNVLVRAGIKFDSIVGLLNKDKKIWNEVHQWCNAAYANKVLKYINIGLLGNFFPGMCDLYVDQTQIIEKFGVNIKLIEMGELRSFVEKVTEEEITENYKKTIETFSLIGDIGLEKLKWCNQVASGLEKFVYEQKLHALAYHFEGYPNSIEEKIGYSMTLGGSFLTAKGIPCVAEGDVLLNIPMLIMKHLSGGSSQAEINVGDYVDDFIYIGHSGPGDLTLADSKPLLRWLDFFHGKKGMGISCEFSLKNGPLTIVSLVQNKKGSYKLICTEANAVSGKRLQNGNINTGVKFSMGIADFFIRWIAEGPSHHSVISVGHHSEILQKFAKIADIEYVRI